MHVAGLVPRSPLPRRPAFRAHPHQQVRSLVPGLAETLVKVTSVAVPVTGHDEIFPSPLVGHSESSKTSVNFGQVAAGWSAHPTRSALPDGLPTCFWSQLGHVATCAELTCQFARASLTASSRTRKQGMATSSAHTLSQRSGFELTINTGASIQTCDQRWADQDSIPNSRLISAKEKMRPAA